MSILDNTVRNGAFSSSKIFNLLKLAKDQKSFGAPAKTYIQEKRYERKLKRSISTDADTRPTLWGKFLEGRVHELLGMEYEHVNDVTLIHPKYPFWVGSPDFLARELKVVSDSKCPQPKAFCELVENCSKGLQTFKSEHEDYYWQLVSNAIITGSEFIELIVYMPYESELEEIRAEAENFDGMDQYKYRFIAESSKHQLAYLPNESEYKNLNVFRFPLDQADAFKLENKVIEASIYLSNDKTIL